MFRLEQPQIRILDSGVIVNASIIDFDEKNIAYWDKAEDKPGFSRSKAVKFKDCEVVTKQEERFVSGTITPEMFVKGKNYWKITPLPKDGWEWIEEI